MVKRIVYIFGAGATQAERNHSGQPEDPRDILIQKCTEKVIEAVKTAGGSRAELLGRYDSERVNIEQLISLLESSNVKEHQDLSEKCKSEFVKYILQLTEGIKPELTMALIEYHELDEKTDKNEQLKGFITINYDNILDNAIEGKRKRIDYGFRKVEHPSDGHIQLMKLHGSFYWLNEFPVNIVKTHVSDDDIPKLVWIPPGVQKDILPYPFNIIWGKSFELLDCDVLRIVGCSLNQNDWSLISLLFRTQLFKENKGYHIEIIASKETCETIKKINGFLNNVKSLSEIPECKDYDNASNDQKFNEFKYWVQSKGKDIFERLSSSAKYSDLKLEDYEYLNKVVSEAKA